MRRSKRNRLLKILGISVGAVLVSVCAVLVLTQRFSALKTRINELSTGLENRDGELTTVWCAAREINAGDRLSEEDFSLCLAHKESVPKDVINDIAELEGKACRIGLSSGMYVTEKMLVNAVLHEDERDMFFSGISFGEEIHAGMFADIRICYGDGSDYIVLSKKEIYEIGTDHSLRMHLSEEEILLLDSAFFDAESFEGVRIYAAGYVEDSVQKAAKVNYSPSVQTMDLIGVCPNINQISTDYLQPGIRLEIEERLRGKNEY